MAPLYADWRIRLSLESVDTVSETVEMPGELKTILPQSAPDRWKAGFAGADPLPAGGFRIRLIPPRALPDAPPLRFANEGLAADGTLPLAKYGSDGSLR